ncbi:MAG: hypothetical protein K2K45_07035 [Muribaculaceae bacterium]|nr:hypothetical protein [Muribaculaceae bacterium]
MSTFRVPQPLSEAVYGLALWMLSCVTLYVVVKLRPLGLDLHCNQLPKPLQLGARYLDLKHIGGKRSRIHILRVLRQVVD